jgi:glycosyltransferase-like protein LARGE
MTVDHVESLLVEDPDDPLGLNGREARLADRVRDVEDQNQVLRHQLSVSQKQLMAHMSNKEKKDDEEEEEEEQREHDPPCKEQVRHKKETH